MNPMLFVKKASHTDIKPFVSEKTYKELNLNPLLIKSIDQKGYERPTEIQEKSIEHLISGQNLIGVASTGTGKTGAFLIPIIEKMLSDKQLSALIVVPTRELAQQVQEEFRSLTKGLSLNSVCFIGGTNVGKDMRLARMNQNLIVGTPGRLNDLMDRRALSLNKTNVLVLDEFDRMLDMGFVNDIRKIVSSMPQRDQTMLFSATIEPAQEKIIKQLVENPIRVNVSSGTKSSDNVDQDIIRVSADENKFDVLLDLLGGESFEKVIVFAETKRVADKISKKLSKAGMRSDVIHGDKSQNYRTKAIKHFKDGTTRVLVATDVAARGIDVDNVTHVVNFQIPQTMDSYIHRIGRTGRAGKTGMAYTFVN